jgi:hypothetical protein
MAANEANVYYQLPIVRVTKLSRCGVPETVCSSITDECVVSIEETGEYRERQEFFPENGAGRFCMEKTSPPLRKWMNVTIIFNDTNPKMIGMTTGDTVKFNDAATPEAIGYGVDQNAIFDSNFALEGWLNLGSRCGDEGACSEEGEELFGYVVYPWIKEATIGDITYGNDTITFTINAIAVRNSPWGVGPYNVVNSAAVATLGDPMPLFDAIAATEYKNMIFTEMAPPTAQCDCIDLVPVLLFADTGVLTGTVTFPTLAGSLPADIDWDDATPVQTVTSGTTASHVYAAPGNYAPTFTPRDTSSATYVAASTPIA